MIRRIIDAGSGFGLEAAGEITPDDIEAIEPQIRHEIAVSRQRPIGILLELSMVKDVELEGWLGGVAILTQIWKFNRACGRD
jgi:hypothetical protein